MGSDNLTKCYLCLSCGEMTADYCRSICDRCQAASRRIEWLDRPAVEWDGKYPIGDWRYGDAYYFDDDDLQEIDIESAWLTTCREDPPPQFDLEHFLQDHIEEGEAIKNAREIEKIVDYWIAVNVPTVYQMTGQRLCLASVRRILGRPENSTSAE